MYFSHELAFQLGWGLQIRLGVIVAVNIIKQHWRYIVLCHSLWGKYKTHIHVSDQVLLHSCMPSPQWMTPLLPLWFNNNSSDRRGWDIVKTRHLQAHTQKNRLWAYEGRLVNRTVGLGRTSFRCIINSMQLLIKMGRSWIQHKVRGCTIDTCNAIAYRLRF